MAIYCYDLVNTQKKNGTFFAGESVKMADAKPSVSRHGAHRRIIMQKKAAGRKKEWLYAITEVCHKLEERQIEEP